MNCKEQFFQNIQKGRQLSGEKVKTGAGMLDGVAVPGADVYLPF